LLDGRARSLHRRIGVRCRWHRVLVFWWLQHGSNLPWFRPGLAREPPG
jgi:hypothetical protein